MTSNEARTGVWFVGARGSVATTAVVGALGVSHGLAPATGLVTELPELAPDGLPHLAGLVFGGHDVSSQSLPKKAEELVAGGVIPRSGRQCRTPRARRRRRGGSPRTRLG